MKKYIIILLLLFAIHHAFSIEIELNYERIDVNFNGVVNSDKSIVCYGTGSIILRSYDNGNNWVQECIHNDSLDIVKSIFDRNEYLCLLSKEYIVKGKPDAKRWESYYTGLSVQTSLAAYKDNIYILSLNTIYIYDRDLILIDIIVINDTNRFNELCIYDEKLLASGTNGILFSIDLQNNNKHEIISFHDLGICTTCFPIRRMRTDNDKLYLSHGTDILKSKDLNNWSNAGKNVSLFDVNNNIVYDLIATHTKYLMSALLKFSVAGIDGNKKISIDWVQRNVGVLAFIDFSFINDSVVVAVGRDKLIAVSKDGGINWKLISNFKATGFCVINDSLFYAIRPKGRIYKTSNAGVTWLPPVFSDTLVLRMQYLKNCRFYENGYGFILYGVESYNYDNLLVTYDYGNTYELRYNYWLNVTLPDHDHIFIDTELGYHVISSTTFQGNEFTSIITLDTALSFIEKNYIDSIHILNVKKIKDKTYLGLAQDKRWPYDKVVSNTDNLNYLIMYSDDDGLTWQTDFDIFMSDTSLKPVINIFNNKLLIGGIHWYKNPKDTPNINQLFLIDLKTKERIRVFNDNLSSYGNVIKYHDFLFIGGWEQLIINPNFEKEPLNWIKIPIRGKYITSINYQFGQFWFYIYDIYTRKQHYYRVNLNLTTYVSDEVETKTYLYSFPPYPNPARNIVRTKIYWDLRYDIEMSDISVYDYKGNKVAGREEININRLNNYSGMLTWDCSKYNAGLYFIVIKHGDSARSIPVIVEK